MDLKRIFLKDACPTSIGGQAIMEGIMMRGPKRTAIAIRLPNGKIHMKTQPTDMPPKWAQIPLIRGVVNFVVSLISGTKVLMSPVSMLMIHNAATIAVGDHAEMQKAIEMLDSVKESIINAYELRTGMSRTKLSHLMDAETWMDAN